MSPQYGELRPTSSWDRFVSLGHPSKFQRVSHLGSITARQSSSERQPNFAALNRGRHLCSAGRPSRWALANILVSNKSLSFILSEWIFTKVWKDVDTGTSSTTTTVLRPFVQDYPGEPVPEQTFTHPPSWSSSNLYQLLPSTTIHSILLVQITCLAIFLHNLSPCPLWSTSWSGALHLIFHTFLRPISVFFSQHMPIPLQPVLL